MRLKEKPRAMTAVGDCTLTLSTINNKWWGAVLLKRLASKRSTKLITLLATLTAFAFAAEAVVSPAAHAGCGGVQQFAAQKRTRGVTPPFAIGDSVMLGAAKNLARAGFDVNVRGCRQMREGLQVLQAKLRSKRSIHLVVIALGSNWRVDSKDIRDALRIMGPKRVLGLVIPRKTGGSSGGDAKVIRTAARKHPGRILVLDWPSFSAPHSRWFDGDGLHLGPAGAVGMTRLLGQVMVYAKPPKLTYAAARGTASTQTTQAIAQASPPTPTQPTPAISQRSWRVKLKWTGFIERPVITLKSTDHSFKPTAFKVKRSAHSFVAILNGGNPNTKITATLSEQARRAGGPRRLDTKTLVLPK